MALKDIQCRQAVSRNKPYKLADGGAGRQGSARKAVVLAQGCHLIVNAGLKLTHWGCGQNLELLGE